MSIFMKSYFLKPTEKNIKNETLERVKNQLDRFDELSVQDVNDICNILKALKK